MAAPFKVTSSFLTSLRTLVPRSSFDLRAQSSNGSERQVGFYSWYITLAVSLSASNRPEGVATVFTHALDELKAQNAAYPDKLLLAQKLREALFNSGLVCGYAKAINGLRELHGVMPEELQDKVLHRNPDESLANYQTIGEKQFKQLYGGISDSVQSLLDTIYPDMGWFSKTIGYGLMYGSSNVLSPLEIAYALSSALIAGDTPQQISWHLDNARRCGASLAEVRAVRQLAIETAKYSGVTWRNTIPDVSEELR